MNDVAIERISKRFAETVALDGVTLSIQAGELLALLGPSGSGKTTLLRVIAGLEHPDSGTLRIDGNDVSDRPPRERGIGFVFQHYALFRHMTVADNIAFGLTVRPRELRPPRAEIAERVRRLLAMVQLADTEARFPAQLSGGQRQRVALARALAVEPRVLLLDEPFGALDAKVRVELRHWLRALHDSLGVTTVFVTHDQDEALELADRVAILNAGRIEQVAPPREIYDKPASAFVMEFLGETNRMPCRVTAERAYIHDSTLIVRTPGMPDGPAFAYVRPHEIELLHVEGANACAAVVRNLTIIGPRVRIHLTRDQQVIEVDADRGRTEALGLAPGATVAMRFTKIRVYPAAGTRS
ncbi:MAG TPA: sulfate/molybdate ABC transporter ATP-binding protein [Stellaceae bacterium]|nr:sulfate/molybdate ABC transporter ATP-binding protein [Stellaceae bacterium]